MNQISQFFIQPTQGNACGSSGDSRAQAQAAISLWWQRGVIYEVYPRSFQDSNGDGVGDLEGLRQRLPYLVELGIDAIWICPFYKSPMCDFGYDVADYCDVDPIFGTLEDFDRLLRYAHDLDLKLIIDFVPNHTSNAHPWFVESRSSRTNPKRDWYIWKDAKPDGSPPNNWIADWAGSAWEWDDTTQQYYAAMLLLLTLRGTPTIYYGDEIGMTDGAITPEFVQDPWGKLQPGLGRDQARTPMQWDDSTNAGFSAAGVRPWLPIAENFTEVNVATQHNPQSMFTLTKHLLHLRRNHVALALGDYCTVYQDERLLAFARRYENEQYLVAINFSQELVVLELLTLVGQILLSTYLDRTQRLFGQLELRADEGVLIQLG